MNSNWRNRPTSIDYFSEEIDYIVSIDESGNHSLKQVLRARKNGKEIVDSEKHFTITGCLLPTSKYEIARDMVMDVKNKYWENALFDYNGHIKRVCFHSKEIRGRKEAFNPDVIEYDNFIYDLSNVMKDIPITLYASHINKVKHVEKYCNPMPPYNLCMTFVLERIVKDIPSDSSCVVVLEARGKTEDSELLDFTKHLIDHGTLYCEKQQFKKIKGVYFNPKWSKLDNEKKSYWTLELADLCAFPIQKFFCYGTEDPAFKILIHKIAHYPHYNGWGLKSFP